MSILDFIIGGFAIVGGSTGFWAWVNRRGLIKTATTQLLLGLAHDRIILLGMQYKDRGWITKDEYEDYLIYLVDPYKSFGGNGLANKVIADVAALPLVNALPHNTPIRIKTNGGYSSIDGENDEKSKDTSVSIRND